MEKYRETANYQQIALRLLFVSIAHITSLFPYPTTHVHHVGLPLAGRTQRNGIEDVGTQTHHHDPYLRQNHQRQDKAGHGEFAGEDRRQIPAGAVNTNDRGSSR